MKTHVTAVVACLLSLLISASSLGDANSSGTEAGVSCNCTPTANPVPNDQLLTTFISSAETQLNAGNACSNFVQGGTLGPWGQQVIREMQSGNYLNLQRGTNISVSNICPNYQYMTTDQQDHFWILVLSSLAFKESSCKPTNSNPNATHGTARGLFQLTDSFCQGRDVNNPSVSINCAMSMLDQQMSKTNASLFDLNSYWEDLRNQSILPAIAEYADCNLP